MTHNEKIFILGDSRTGTTSLHRYMQVLGFRSMHYFMKESEQESPNHEHHEENYARFRDFVDNSGFQAFSDYPTRSFYKELYRDYPDAYFILTYRKDLETWRRSMDQFFSKFDMNINLDELSRHYLRINEEIEKIYTDAGVNFLSVCIDDDNEENSKKIKKFLGSTSKSRIGWENKTSQYDNNLYSQRATFFGTEDEQFLDYVEAACFPSKAMPSEHGWVYLCNDTNDFLKYQCGFKSWTPEIADRAAVIIRERTARLKADGREYLHVAVPEKSVIYPEYLPRIFAGKDLTAPRPATMIEERALENFLYLGDFLRDLKSIGLLYFRGDSHTNWLGAYFVYLSIYNAIKQKFPTVNPGPLVALETLTPVLAAYGGDLLTQLSKEHQAVFDNTYRNLKFRRGVEFLTRYFLANDDKKTKAVDLPDDYQAAFGGRPLFAFEHPDKNLPRAVIFRDSTSDFIVDLLAEHFSRSVFIWRGGHVFEDVVEREQPDIVIHIMAERFLVQYEVAQPFLKGLSMKPDAREFADDAAPAKPAG